MSKGNSGHFSGTIGEPKDTPERDIPKDEPNKQEKQTQECNSGDFSDTIGSSKDVWDSIVPTQPNYPETVLPRSFVIKTDGKTLWVHGNATEHMAEYLIMQANSGYSSESTKLMAQIMLYDIQQALGAVTKDGLSYGKMLRYGNWDFIINRARNGELYDAVIHAFFKKREDLL